MPYFCSFDSCITTNPYSLLGASPKESNLFIISYFYLTVQKQISQGWYYNCISRLATYIGPKETNAKNIGLIVG